MRESIACSIETRWVLPKRLNEQASIHLAHRRPAVPKVFVSPPATNLANQVGNLVAAVPENLPVAHTHSVQHIQQIVGLAGRDARIDHREKEIIRVLRLVGKGRPSPGGVCVQVVIPLHSAVKDVKKDLGELYPVPARYRCSVLCIFCVETTYCSDKAPKMIASLRHFEVREPAVSSCS